MRHTWQDFMVGLTSIIALAGLSTLLLFFGELTFLLEKRFTLPMRVNAASGLRVGSQVMLEGVPVGEVTGIELEPGMRFPVVLKLEIDAAQRIPTTVRPTISAGLLGGGSRIDFRIPPSTDVVVMIDPKNPPTLEAKFTSFGEQVDSILARLTSGEGTLGRLISDPQLYNEMTDAAQRLSLTLRDLQMLVRKVKEEGLELKF